MKEDGSYSFTRICKSLSPIHYQQYAQKVHYSKPTCLGAVPLVDLFDTQRGVGKVTTVSQAPHTVNP